MGKLFISVKELSHVLKVHPSTTRKIVLGMGIKPAKRRLPDSRNQTCLALTADEARRVVRCRLSIGCQIAGHHNTVKYECCLHELDCRIQSLRDELTSLLDLVGVIKHLNQR